MIKLRFLESWNEQYVNEVKTVIWQTVSLKRDSKRKARRWKRKKRTTGIAAGVEITEKENTSLIWT